MKRSRWDDDDDDDDREPPPPPRAPETVSQIAADVAHSPARGASEPAVAQVAQPDASSGAPAANGRRKVHATASFTGKPMPVLDGCRSVDCYQKMSKIDEGTYGVVYKCRDRETGDIVAVKQIKQHKGVEGFPITSLREINILLALDHENIINVREVVTDPTGKIFMVMDYMEHDLKALMAAMKHPFAQSEVKCLLLQLLRATEYMHEHWVLHRDLKTSNLLFSNGGVLNVCDFGMARKYGDPIKPMTNEVVTLWYRAPEILLGAKLYTPAVDMWSVGCIFAEILTMKPLLPGQGPIDQLERMFKLLGTPNDTIWPGFSDLPNAKTVGWKHYPYNRLKETFRMPSFSSSGPLLTDNGVDLLNRMLTYDPERRITAKEALMHPYFREDPPPKPVALMPTFPTAHR